MLSTDTPSAVGMQPYLHWIISSELKASFADVGDLGIDTRGVLLFWVGGVGGRSGPKGGTQRGL